MSYLPTIITPLSGPGAALLETAGGQSVTVAGRYFGPPDACAVALLSVYHDTVLQLPTQGGVTRLS